MIDCSIRVQGLYVLNNKFVLNIVGRCDLHAQRFVVTPAKQSIFVILSPV